MWFKNAVIYNLDVETFQDSDGDGYGDFQGLIRRIPYLESLGVDCVWLQPFQPTPNRDDGYDITDYYAVDPRLGTLGDFADFAHELSQRGIRLILDLVVNHTSDQHPWFQAALQDPTSRWRDFYIWSKEEPADKHEGMVFPGVQETTWTYKEEVGAWYFHRFFDHQPDLNIANPAVRAEILRIMGFWLQLGVAGFRVDAAPFVIELTGRGQAQDAALHGFIQEMSRVLSWRRGDGVMLAEANVANDQVKDYVGDGDRMHMLFSFGVNQALFLSLARGRSAPLARALCDAPAMPVKAAWAQFLRGHDEIDLGRLSEAERQEVYAAFGPEKHMQIYDRGIRRRLAPMLGNDRRRIELAHSLLMALPGTQVIRYGDEIGMGDDLSLQERLAVRTPMQWSGAVNGGFSTAPADRLRLPVIAQGEFAYDKVNVEDQARREGSLLDRVQRLIRVRSACPEIGTGAARIIETDTPAVLAHLCQGQDQATLVLHNLASGDCTARLQGWAGPGLVELAADRTYPPAGATIELAGYGYRWFRVQGRVPDETP
jgi:maltose alpha-D-glucosyltransferase/alpha-amylase